MKSTDGVRLVLQLINKVKDNIKKNTQSAMKATAATNPVKQDKGIRAGKM